MSAAEVFDLRPAQPTDAGGVGSILTDFVQESEWMPCLHSGAEDIAFAGQMIDRGWVTVAVDDQGVLAFLARDRHIIHALYARLDARSSGAGHALMARAKAASDRLEAWTFQDNRGAQRFYQREGFVEEKRTDGAANDEGLPDILYVWTKETAP